MASSFDGDFRPAISFLLMLLAAGLTVATIFAGQMIVMTPLLGGISAICYARLSVYNPFALRTVAALERLYIKLLDDSGATGVYALLFGHDYCRSRGGYDKVFGCQHRLLSLFALVIKAMKIFHCLIKSSDGSDDRAGVFSLSAGSLWRFFMALLPLTLANLLPRLADDGSTILGRK